MADKRTFVCLSVSSERTEATSYWWTEGGFRSHWGGGRVFMPSSPGVGRKDLGASATRFPPTAWDGMTPIGVVPIGASRLWGIGKGSVIGPKP